MMKGIKAHENDHAGMMGGQQAVQVLKLAAQPVASAHSTACINLHIAPAAALRTRGTGAEPPGLNEEVVPCKAPGRLSATAQVEGRTESY